MATPPLPDHPCVRVRCVWNIGTPGEGGVRFYIKYSGTAPSGADCVTLATDVANAWASHVISLIPAYWSLNEVDVLDIATDSGNSGQWTGTHTGTRSGTSLPAQVATNIEFGIARRYRGGKPRMYIPGGVDADTDTESRWTSGFVSAVETGITDFFAAIESSSVGGMGTLTHVNVSFYKGYLNVEVPGSRAYSKPMYRTDAAVTDEVKSYIPKFIMGSQRRRRTSTTP